MAEKELLTMEHPLVKRSHTIQLQYERRLAQGVTTPEFEKILNENWEFEGSGIKVFPSENAWMRALDQRVLVHAKYREEKMISMTGEVIHLTKWIRWLTFAMLAFTVVLIVIELAKW